MDNRFPLFELLSTIERVSSMIDENNTNDSDDSEGLRENEINSEDESSSQYENENDDVNNISVHPMITTQQWVHSPEHANASNPELTSATNRHTIMDMPEVRNHASRVLPDFLHQHATTYFIDILTDGPINSQNAQNNSSSRRRMNRRRREEELQMNSADAKRNIERQMSKLQSDFHKTMRNEKFMRKKYHTELVILKDQHNKLLKLLKCHAAYVNQVESSYQEKIDNHNSTENISSTLNVTKPYFEVSETCQICFSTYSDYVWDDFDKSQVEYNHRYIFKNSRKSTYLWSCGHTTCVDCRMSILKTNASNQELIESVKCPFCSTVENVPVS